jgi:low temperature requirement protein LtrA
VNATPGTPRLLRVRAEGRGQPVTNVELFFDLVFVFAITQLSRHLQALPTVDGAVQTLVLFGAVWITWSYTTWVTNWLDPGQLRIRLMLLGVMLTSLVFSACLPDAFSSRGLAVAVTFVLMQVGRTVFTIAALSNHPLRRNFERILAWTVTSSVLWIVGVLTHGHGREAVWAAAVLIDLAGGEVGFYTPGLGRSATTEWNIEGGHFAERCQAFVLIALGESVVEIGSALTRTASPDGAEITTFALAFVGCVALWWIYFDRSAEEAARELTSAADPGRLGRSAYHYIHPIMVAGIVVIAAADGRVLEHPGEVGSIATAVMVLGGTGLFVGGHALFKYAIWGVVSVPRILGLVVLALAMSIVTVAPAFVLGLVGGAVMVGIAVADRWLYGPVPAGKGSSL